MINRDTVTGELLVDNSERLTFGKYKGKLIATLMITDVRYLMWLITSDNKYLISDTWRKYLENYAEEQSRKVYCTYMR